MTRPDKKEAAKKTSSLRQRPQKLLMAERVLRRKAVVLLHFEERLSKLGVPRDQGEAVVPVTLVCALLLRLFG